MKLADKIREEVTKYRRETGETNSDNRGAIFLHPKDLKQLRAESKLIVTTSENSDYEGEGCAQMHGMSVFEDPTIDRERTPVVLPYDIDTLHPKDMFVKNPLLIHAQQLIERLPAKEVEGKRRGEGRYVVYVPFTLKAEEIDLFDRVTEADRLWFTGRSKYTDHPVEQRNEYETEEEEHEMHTVREDKVELVSFSAPVKVESPEKVLAKRLVEFCNESMMISHRLTGTKRKEYVWFNEDKPKESGCSNREIPDYTVFTQEEDDFVGVRVREFGSLVLNPGIVEDAREKFTRAADIQW